MTNMIVKAFLAAGLPAAVLSGGDCVLSRASDRMPVGNQPTQTKQDIPKPLNLRWLGYGVEAALAFWTKLGEVGRQAETRFLFLGLLFPLFYGGALAASLWWVWVTLGQPFHPVWIAAPLVIILMADWTENLIQLAQLRHYVSSNEGRFPALWIQVSSFATIIKLCLMVGLYAGLIGLVVKMVFVLSARRIVADATE
jgi:hypothetical protein